MRGLIADRLAPLDRPAALARLWLFIETARRVAPRLRDREGTIEAVYGRAAADAGGLIVGLDPHMAAAALVEALVANPFAWAAWLPGLLASAPTATAEAALQQMSERRGAVPGWLLLARQLADAAQDVEAYRATYAGALEEPAIAAKVARRYLAATRTEEAGDILKAAAPKPGRRGVRAQEPSFDWESAWIDYLEQSGRSAEAQAVRWVSFERTLSVDRAKAFIGRLGDFDDVEAEARAMDHARGHADFERALQFLMAWPALVDAGRIIEARPDEIEATLEEAELWSSQLRRRQPKAANLLLRKAAAAAFRRRDYKTCDRLTAEADTIDL